MIFVEVICVSHCHGLYTCFWLLLSVLWYLRLLDVVAVRLVISFCTWSFVGSSDR